MQQRPSRQRLSSNADVATNDSELWPNRWQVSRSLTRLVAKLLVRFIGKPRQTKFPEAQQAIPSVHQ
jgi:hypothetical protein